MLPPGWQRAVDQQGRTYDHNDITRETPWEPPPQTQQQPEAMTMNQTATVNTRTFAGPAAAVEQQTQAPCRCACPSTGSLAPRDSCIPFYGVGLISRLIVTVVAADPESIWLLQLVDLPPRRRMGGACVGIVPHGIMEGGGGEGSRKWW
jgi:hypothetical protein